MPVTYTPSTISRYAGNPLVEALPPGLADQEIIDRLQSYPPVSKQDLLLPTKDRMACVSALYDVFQPTMFHLNLANVLSTILREGYHGRNPADPSTLAHSHWLATQGLDGAPRPHPGKLTARSVFVTGLSRMGKTRAIERILSLYPQVLQHTNYCGQPLPLTQVTWLKVSTPKNGSLRDLSLAFFMALDDLFGGDLYTQQAMRHTRGDTALIPLVRKKARELSLGVLVVDELQRLSLLRSKGKTEIQKFLHSLIDEVGIPVVFIGTYQAYEVFSGSLQETARIAGVGCYELTRPSKGSAEWEFLVETLWRFQWLKNAQPLESIILDKLYDITQGVTEVLVTLLVIAQWKAMQAGEERITTDILKEIENNELGPLKAPLQALASGVPSRLKTYEDLIPSTDIRNGITGSAYDGLLEWSIKSVVTEAINERLGSAPLATPPSDNESHEATKGLVPRNAIDPSAKITNSHDKPAVADLRDLSSQPDALGELAKSGMLLSPSAMLDPIRPDLASESIDD